MPNLIPKIPKGDILKLLPDSVDQSKIMGELKELTDSASLTQARKRFFRLRLSDKPDLHLSYGCGLENAYDRAASFHEVLPQYTCKPIFGIEDGEFHLFGQEFFDGQPIDECLESGRKTVEEVTSVLATLTTALDSLERPSSKEAIAEELEDFQELVLSNEHLPDLDRRLLVDSMFPCLKKTLERLNPTIRWSSGDLAARNILLTDDNTFKIVDCEFACETHFHEEDWLRLAFFSSGPFAELRLVQERLRSVSGGINAFFRIRQVQLNQYVHSGKDYPQYAAQDLAECLWAIGNAQNNSGLGSLMLEGVANAKKELMTALAAENKSRLAKEAELKAENEIRVTKENELERKLDKIRRLEDSFSWKVTTPLRFLRRHLLDFLRPCHQNSNDDPSASKKRTYTEWVRRYDTLTAEKIGKIQHAADNLKKKPLLSVLMPVYNTPENFLRKAIESVLDQIYENWELCIADDASTQPHVRSVLEEYADRDSRIKVVCRETNGHISATSNSALETATGKFVAFLDHDDELRPHSLLRLVETINERPDATIIYSDEDKLDSKGRRTCPYFKPDWNPDLLLAQNYLCHLFCVKRSLVLEAGKFRTGYEGSQDWDLVLRIVDLAEGSTIIHLPEILYHWRIHPDSTARTISNKGYAVKAAQKAVQDHLTRNKVRAEVTVSKKQFIRVRREPTVNANPTTTIIIPTRDNADTLKACLESIYEKTNSPTYEILLVDNQSSEPEALQLYKREERRANLTLIHFEEEFNYSAINNFAAQKASGKILVFLNDDTVVKNSDWLQELISQAVREEIGAVGAKLLYPHGIYQHAGILLGYCKIAGEMMKGLPGNHPGQMQRANLVHNVSAVTGACMAIEKTKFDAIGGFDEVNLKIAFNDVDLCLRLLERSWRNLYTPHATLFHHESKSRGQENTPSKKSRFQSEIDYMQERWGHLLDKDPAYNPNLSLNWQELFEPAFPPRRNGTAEDNSGDET